MTQQQQRQNSQPNVLDRDKMKAGIDIVETRKRVDELRAGIINFTGRNMDAPLIIIKKWIKEDNKPT